MGEIKRVAFCALTRLHIATIKEFNTIATLETQAIDSDVQRCVCIAMSCGGGSFTPDGAFDSLWDSRTRPVQKIPNKTPVSMRIGFTDYSI